MRIWRRPKVLTGPRRMLYLVHRRGVRVDREWRNRALLHAVRPEREFWPHFLSSSAATPPGVGAKKVSRKLDTSINLQVVVPIRGREAFSFR
jgi:hypothetical protein